MATLRQLPLMALAGVLLFSAISPAQHASPAARIVDPIDENQLVTLKGNVNPHANAKNDRGPVSDSLPLDDLTLVLGRTPEQQAAFDAYVQSEYDPGSPNYHKWLTPSQIGNQFGPAAPDISAVTGWLASHGFTVKSVAPDGMTIRFAGTASQVRIAFHTEIHNLVVNGASHYANMTDPQIPAALAPVVVGVKALHNFLPHPMHRVGGKVQFNKETGRWQRVASPAQDSTSASESSGAKSSFDSSAVAASAAAKASMGARPMFGINVPANPSTGSSAYLEEDVTPWDFATIYNVTPLWSNNINGSNQTIAIAGTSEITQSDVATFRSAFGLPALSSFNEIDTNGLATICNSTNPLAVCGIGDLDENTLDVEWSGAVAPGANIVLVVTGQNAAGSIDTVYDSAQYAVQNETAKILNVSYGLCELFQGATENVAFYDLWQSAAAEGISVFVASGDSGSPVCDDGGDSIGYPYSAQYGLSVSGLASTPFNVAVGGTDFSWCKPEINSSGNITGCPTSSTSQGSPAYWNTANNTTTEPYESAAGYVPEIPWNDTCLNPINASYIESLASNYLGISAGSNPEASCNFIQKDWAEIYNTDGIMLANFIDTVGGSGGASNCVSNTEDTDANNPTCNATATSVANGSGSIALTNDGWQKPTWQTGVAGIPNDGVRDLPDVSFFAGDGALYSAYLVCISAEGACTYGDTVENYYEEFGGTSFASPAMAGVMSLINQKSGAPQGLPNQQLYQLAAMQNYSQCSSEGPPSSSCYFHSIDQGTNAMPCDLGAPEGGAVYGSGGWQSGQMYAGIDSPNCVALNSGDTVGTLVSSGTTPGYNATAGYNLATGLGTLNVANVVNAWVSDAGTNPDTMAVTTTPAAGAGGTITVGSDVNLVIVATMTFSGTPPTQPGTIVVTGGGYNADQALSSSGAATVTIPAGTLAPGTVTLTVSYSGDSTYVSASQTLTLSVQATIPTVTVTAPTSDNIVNPVSVAVTVSGPVSGKVPTGNVALTGGAYSSTAVTLSSSGTANFTVPAGQLPAGTDTLTATYIGDSNYATNTGTATIVMVSTTPATPTITVTPSSTSIDTSQSLSVTVAVTGTAGAVPSGTVTLTSASSTSSGASWSGALISGIATIAIPGNSLNGNSSGEKDALSAVYNGDAVYSYGTGTGSVTVTQSSYTLAATAPAAVSQGGSATSTITGNTSTTDYTGTVTLSNCTITASPTNAVNLPSCFVTGTITYAAGVASGTGTATVTTYANVSSMLDSHPFKVLYGAGGTVLAFLVFLGIPARRKSWRALLGALVLLAGLGTLSACGGGGGGGTTQNTATSPGSYTFQVTGTGNDPASVSTTTTFSLTVN